MIRVLSGVQLHTAWEMFDLGQTDYWGVSFQWGVLSGKTSKRPHSGFCREGISSVIGTQVKIKVENEG